MNLFSRTLPVCEAAILVALTGCFSVSIPLKPVVIGQKIKPADLEWIRPGETTRQEIVANWGPPSFELPRERLLGYACTIDKNASWQFWHIGSDPVIKEGTWGTDSRTGALFAFDDEDRIIKFEIVPLDESVTPEEAATTWLKGGRALSRGVKTNRSGHGAIR